MKIFHNHTELFNKPGTHYHHAMKAGENTLHLRVAEVAMQHIVEKWTQQQQQKHQKQEREKNIPSSPPYDLQSYAQSFISFMTSPHAHPDTYIGGAMRYFFARYAETGIVENHGLNDPCVSGLTLIIPLILLLAHPKGEEIEQRYQLIKRHLFLTHASPLLYTCSLELRNLAERLLYRRSTSMKDRNMNENERGMISDSLDIAEARNLLGDSLLKLMEIGSAVTSENVPQTCGIFLRKKAMKAHENEDNKLDSQQKQIAKEEHQHEQHRNGDESNSASTSIHTTNKENKKANVDESTSKGEEMSHPISSSHEQTIESGIRNAMSQLSRGNHSSPPHVVDRLEARDQSIATDPHYLQWKHSSAAKTRLSGSNYTLNENSINVTK